MKQLNAIEPAIEKQKQIAQADVTLELRLDDRVEPVEALTHVNVLGVEIDLRLSQRRGNDTGCIAPAPCLSRADNDFAKRVRMFPP